MTIQTPIADPQAQGRPDPAVAPLFEPFRLKGLALPNRIVMAPMTRAQAPDNVPGPANAAYYRRRAEGGVGLILSEGTVIDREASWNLPGIPFFHGAPALAGWGGVIDAVHAAGGRMGPQIWHTGSTTTGWEPPFEVESPSGLLAPGQPRGRAMTEGDVADTVASFGRAAADARRLGFDVVEIHGAHGYLVDEFLWAGTNARTDRWGGATLPERARFAVEVVRAVRAGAGDLPVILRLSQWKQQDYAARLAETPDEMAAWLGPLAEAGVDAFHCSQRRFWEPEFPDVDGAEGLNFAGWAKKLTGAATISVGSVGLAGADFLASYAGEGAQAARLDDLARRLEREEFDLVAVGRAVLADPAWAAKVRAGDREGLRDFDPAAMATLT